MEITKGELAVVESVAECALVQIEELNELQLALAGGGCGEVLFG